MGNPQDTGIWRMTYGAKFYPPNPTDYGMDVYDITNSKRGSFFEFDPVQNGTSQTLHLCDKSGLTNFRVYFTQGLFIYNISYVFYPYVCPPDSCRVDCPNLPFGFCCIDHDVTDRLLAVLQNV